MTCPTEHIPSFVCDTLRTHYPQQTIASIAEGCTEARRRPVTLRANTLKTTTDAVAAALEAAGIAYTRVPWYPDAFVLHEVRERSVWELDIYRTGAVYLQSLSSMIPALVLAPRAGADVLDMCAAPGGKTSQMAALAHGAAHLTACEMNGPRAEKLQHNLAKLGVDHVQVMRCDARRLDEFFRFDQILVDAPCTGTGTMRTDDERASRRITGALLAKTVKSQRALLDRGLTILKTGGTLVYSTCSILPEENDEIVSDALKRHRDCELVPLVLGEVGATTEDDVATQDDGKPQPICLAGAEAGDLAIPRLAGTEVSPMLTVAPTRLFEGFFVAVIQKR